MILLLCACLLLQPILGVFPAFAEETADTGLCEHHPEHTDECGYIKEEEGSPCLHVHDGDCGYQQPTVGFSGSECTHVHDKACGYREAVKGNPCGFICKRCAARPVYFWQWVDEEEILLWVEELQQWGVGLPGVSEESPVTGEVLGELLPSEVTVWLTPGTPLAGEDEPEEDQDGERPETSKQPDKVAGNEEPPKEQLTVILPGQTADREEKTSADTEEKNPGERPLPPLSYGASSWEKGEGVKLPITWDFSALPAEGAYEGEYVFTASLPEEYALVQDAPVLSVYVLLGGELFAGLDLKPLNHWRFVDLTNIDADLLEGKIEALDTSGNKISINRPKQTIEAAIGDLEKRTADEIWSFLVETTLPKKIRGWGFNTGSSMVNAGIKLDSSHVEDPYALEYDSVKKEARYRNYPGGVWGTVDIVWRPFVAPQDSYSEGDTVTFYAYIEPYPQENPTYQVVVNSNDPADHASGKGDSSTNPDILSMTVTLRNLPLSGHTVSPVEPANTTVNLFDYWVYDDAEKPSAPDGDILKNKHRHNNAAEISQLYSGKASWNEGINRGHLLLFGDGNIHAGLWNKGAGAGTTAASYGRTHAGMEGIVRPVLGADGYPLVNSDAAAQELGAYTAVSEYKLAADCTSGGKDDTATYSSLNPTGVGRKLSQTVMDGWDGKESLDYLFTPHDGTPNKKSFTDVKGLFQLDDDGYYTYNMRDNFAEFDEVSNNFILYDAPGTFRTDGRSSLGNFFPFNRGGEVFNTLSGDHLGTTVDNHGNAMNHHFGMTVEIDFSQPLGGRINAGSGGSTPMTFEFSGDDDVWVFIDDVLVLDLGGVHSELYGVIDFSTGEIHIGRGFETNGIPDHPEGSNGQYKTTTIREMFEQALGKDAADRIYWNRNTFASNTTHTLKMFYLERGNYDSSLALRFNLQPMLYQQLRKVDQNGEPIGSVEFELYPAQETHEQDAAGIPCFYTDSNVHNGDLFYVKRTAGADRLVTLKTQADGYARFLDDNGNYFNFADQGDQYYILHEIAAPPGYRKQPVDMVLHYDASTSMLTVANRWSTGAYAVSVSYITAIGRLNYGQFDEQDEIIKPDTGSTVASDAQENGLAVAVPMMQRRSDKTWQALYGGNLTGFYASPVRKGADGETRRRALLRAVLEQAQNTDAADWFLSWDDGNRRLSGVLNDLPGLASRYQGYGSGGDMRMVCAIIEPEGLDVLGISENSAEGRYQKLGEYVRSHGVEDTMQTIIGKSGFNFLDAGQFGQEFRSLLYVPNERRELWVQKVNQAGEPVNGAQFGLYRDAGCTNLVASGWTSSAGGQEGTLIFSPSDRNEPGYAQVIWAAQREGSQERAHYYLKEISAPAGCTLNETVVPVVVGTYSIYADAGAEEDGITVMAGVGRLTQTMRQYAAENDVDVTLQDITAFGQTQPSANTEALAKDWEDMRLLGTSIPRSMNLHFGRNAIVDYGLHNADGGLLYRPFFVTDTGFIRARVKQNYAALLGGIYDGAKPDANTEDLGDSDLTDLFSLLNIVVVTDQDAALPSGGRLTVSKRVAGNALSTADYTKNFTFTIRLTGADGRPLPGRYYFYGTDKAGYLSDGDVFPLHHDESITILGLPAGTSYSVQESKETGWFVSPGNGEVSGEVLSGGSSAAAFLNSTEPLPETGSLKIQKTVSGEGGDKSRAFTFTLLFKDRAGKELTGSFDYSGSKTGRIASGGQISLRHNESVVIAGLPAGTVYAVSEEEANKDGYLTSSAGETGDIQKDYTAAAVFTNSTEPLPETGSLKIQKTVSGEGGDKSRAFTFTVLLKDKAGKTLTGSFDYSGSRTGRIANGETVSLRHEESVIIVGLPAGTVYTVTEIEADREGYTTASTGGTGSIQKGRAALAAFINTAGGSSSGSDPGPDTKPDPEPGPNPDSSSDPGPDTRPDPEPGPNPDFSSDPEPGPKSDPNSKPEKSPGPVSPPTEKDIANTGDRFPLLLWLSLFGISLAGAVSFLLIGRRGRTKGNMKHK